MAKKPTPVVCRGPIRSVLPPGTEGTGGDHMGRRGLTIDVEQELRGGDPGFAVAEDPVVDLRAHGLVIAMPCVGSATSATDADAGADEVDGQAAETLLHQA